MTGYVVSLAGGMLIGLAAAVLLLVNGRIAGVSGISAGLMGTPDRDTLWRALFLAGLLLGVLLFTAVVGHAPTVRIDASWPLLIAGGLLVGFGTRLGSGCTSGHGVCGLGRLSRRSFAAVATFILFAVATVFAMRHGFSR